RSTGGASRPAFPVRIGAGAVVAPLCVLTGCTLGDGCYVATGAIVLQGAVVGAGSRIGVGAIVHAGANLPQVSGVGLRHLAIPQEDGVLITADVVTARVQLATAGFFDAVFGEWDGDQETLHRRVQEVLMEEVHGWHGEPLVAGDGMPRRR